MKSSRDFIVTKNEYLAQKKSEDYWEKEHMKNRFVDVHSNMTIEPFHRNSQKLQLTAKTRR